jgi:hypothetical protein
MSVTLAAALLLQATAIMLLRVQLGRLWLRHPVSVMVLTSAVYQGVTPLLDAVPSVDAGNIFRTGIQQSYFDSATFIMSAGILAFTVAYLLARPERIAPQADLGDARFRLSALDWRWLACGCIPLGILTYEGRGYNNTGPSIGNGAPLAVELASEFFLILVVLTAFSFLLKCGPRFFLPVLIAQSLILAAAGERRPVIADAIILAVLLAHAGFRLRRRQVIASGALIVVVVLAITGSRAHQGRALYTEDNGLVTRVQGLSQGLTTAPEPGGSGTGLLSQAAERLDGVDFAGGIQQAVHLGQPRLSPSQVPESLLVAVPSALWPSKLSHQNILNPTQLETGYFGLQKVNFLPTLPGMYMGILTPEWLTVFLGFLGLLAGQGERMLLRRLTAARVVLLAGALSAALIYEQGLPGMLVALRSAAAVALVVKLVELALARRALRRSASAETAGSLGGRRWGTTLTRSWRGSEPRSPGLSFTTPIRTARSGPP